MSSASSPPECGDTTSESYWVDNEEGGQSSIRTQETSHSNAPHSHPTLGGDAGDAGDESAKRGSANVNKAGSSCAEDKTKTIMRPYSSKNDGAKNLTALLPPPRSHGGKAAAEGATTKKDGAAATAAAAATSADVGLAKNLSTTASGTKEEGQGATDPLPVPTTVTAATGREGNDVTKPMPHPEVIAVQAPPQVPSNVRRDPPPSFQPRLGLFSGDPDEPVQLSGSSADHHQQQQQEQIGAVHVSSTHQSVTRVREGHGRREMLHPSRSRTDNTVGTVPVLEATLVDQDDEAPLVETPPLVVATRADESARGDDSCIFNFRSQRGQLVLALVVAIITALAVGLGIALSGNDGGDGTNRGGTDNAASERAPQQIDEGAQLPNQANITSILTPPPSTAAASTDTTSGPIIPPTSLPTRTSTLQPTMSPTSPPTKSPKFSLCLATRLRPVEGSSSYGVFGSTVAISGSKIAVGAPYDDDNGENSGSVTAYTRSSSGWLLQEKILSSDGAAGDKFGKTVSIDGNTIAVGAPNKDNNRGAVYVFIWDGSMWNEQAKIVPQDSSEGDYFGWSVIIDNDRIIVGAPQGYINRGRGKAYIFAFMGLTWAEEAKLEPGDGASDDASFGQSVSLRNGTALVGAPFDDTNKGTDSGSVYAYDYNGASHDAWKELPKLLPEDGSNSDKLFGNSVFLLEDMSKAIIGARHDDSQGTNSGSAYIFVRIDSSWTEESKHLPNAGADWDYFGISAVLINATVAVIGANQDNDKGIWSGSLYLLIVEEDGGLTQKSKVVPDDGKADDWFGYSLAVDKGTVVVGTSGGNKAYVYELC